MRVRGRRFGLVATAALVAFAVVAVACGGDRAAPASDGDVSPLTDAALPVDASLREAVRSPANVATFLSGEGDGAMSFEASGGLTVIDVGHVGKGPFRVTLRASDSDGASETLVERVGAWVGTVQLGLASGGYVLDVVADGVWFADVRELRDEPAIAPGAYVGNREAFGRWEEKATPIAKEARINGEYLFGEERWSVTPPVALSGEVSVGFMYGVPLPFEVRFVDESGEVVESLVEGTGGRERASTIDVPDGVYRVVVEADGVWSLVIRPW